MTITVRCTKQGEGRGGLLDHPTDKGIIPEILQQTFEEMEKQVAESVKSVKSKLVIFEERMEEKFIEMKEVTKLIEEIYRVFNGRRSTALNSKRRSTALKESLT